jgi:hypothetical protein
MKRSTRSRPSDRQPPSVPGAILSDALYCLDEAAARMGWGAHAMRAASADDQSTEVDLAAGATPLLQSAGVCRRCRPMTAE